MRVLYVDNAQKWLRSRRIFWSIHDHEVTTSFSIDTARELIATAELAFERIVIDEDIVSNGDGADFAKELVDAGTPNVVILALYPQLSERPGVRLVVRAKDKSEFVLMKELFASDE